ncbi:MAG: HlyD family efflux transporter periplasmic adaptor subunit [Planctomycetota bacterium]|jgi:putative peptide zinc metalloprotease protein
MSEQPLPSEDEARPSLSSQLRNIQIGLREDLEVSRHLFRGKPYYIVRDPITFQSQKLTPGDYDVFVRINAGRSLGTIFEELVAEDRASENQEEAFFQFIMSLHRIGFLQLPVSDDKVLYHRYRKKMRAKAKEKIFGIMFLKIPLVNPDAFLQRTMRHVQWMFSPQFFLVWLAVIATAGWIVFRRWHDLAEPVQGLLATQNIVLMWITLIGLKIYHELGHAYCCKYFGGHVPEMGAFLILFTPCAYVDATSTWGFQAKRHRIYVCLAGMYFESMLAALAVFVWAMTGPGLINSAAYNAIFLATVVTVLFNINPLMRYDGYYVLSDLVEIPNLRAKSVAHVLGVLKRLFFGVPNVNAPARRRERIILLTYGVASSIYKVALVLGISAMLAMKMFLVGVIFAVFYMGSTVFKSLTQLTSYLWHTPETAHARVRAALITGVVFLLVPSALFLVPMPSSVVAGAVLLAEKEIIAHVREPGFVRQVEVTSGDVVEQGRRLTVLENDAYDEAVASTEAEIHANGIRVDAFRIHQPAFVRQEQTKGIALQQAYHHALDRRADLQVDAPIHGRVIDCVDRDDTGRFLEAGAPVATIVSGRWQIRAILSEAQIASVNPQVGDEVAFKTVAHTAQTIKGVVVRIAPAGSRLVELASLTHLAGGAIAVNPVDGTAAEPYFELTVDLPAETLQGMRYGMTGTIRMPAKAEPIGVRLGHRTARFLNRLFRE